jgi:hypothetical protein
MPLTRLGTRRYSSSSLCCSDYAFDQSRNSSPLLAVLALFGLRLRPGWGLVTAPCHPRAAHTTPPTRLGTHHRTHRRPLTARTMPSTRLRTRCCSSPSSRGSDTNHAGTHRQPIKSLHAVRISMLILGSTSRVLICRRARELCHRLACSEDLPAHLLCSGTSSLTCLLGRLSRPLAMLGDFIASPAQKTIPIT